jgi:preprotein translocase subunit SecD
MSLIPNWGAIAEQWLGGVIESNPLITSADKLFAYIQPTELYMPRVYVRQWWNENVRAQNYTNLIENMKDDDVIPRSFYKTTDRQYHDNYAEIYKVTGRNAITGEKMEQYVTVTYNQRTTRWESQMQLDEYISHYEFDLAPGAIKTKLQGVYHVRGRRL